MKYVAEIIGGVLIIAASLAFDLGTLSTVAPKLVALYAIGAIGLGILTHHVWRDGTIALTRFDLALGALFAWAALSLAWSPDPAGGLYSLIHIAVFLIVYLVAKWIPFDSMRRMATWGVTIAIVAMLALTVTAEYKITTDTNGGFGNANFFAEYLMIGAPFVAWLAWHRRVHLDAWLYILVVLAALYVLFFVTGSRMPYVGMGAVCIVAAWHQRQSVGWIVGIVVIAAAVTTQWEYIEQPAIHSFLSRLEIWFNSALLWAERPFVGWGLGGFAYEYDRVHMLHLKLIPEVFVARPTIFTEPAQFTSEAHNEIVQMAVEIGLIGLTLASAAIWFMVKSISDDASLRSPPLTCRSFLIASLAITGAASLAEFPLHNPATAMLTAIAAGILLRDDLDPVTIFLPRIARIPATIAPAALSVALAFFSFQVYAGYRAMSVWQNHSDAMKKAENAPFIGEDPKQWAWASPYAAFLANVAAWKAMPLDPWRRRQMMLTLGNLDRKWPDKVRISPSAAELAYKVSKSAAPHTPAVMLNRIMYLMEKNKLDSDEIPLLLNKLSRNSFVHVHYWILEGWYSLYRGYVDRAVTALKQARVYQKQPDIHDVDRLAQAIEKVRKTL